jgi:hypothetical protein
MQADPFVKMAEMLELLRQHTRGRTPDGARIEDLLRVATALETVYAWAAEMQLGAEGFDNTTSAQAYSEIQEHLVSAARDIEKACKILHQMDGAY